MPETPSSKRELRNNNTKTRKRRWEYDQDMLLVDAVQCRPSLYNKDVLSMEIKKSIWDEVGENLGLTGESNKKATVMKWKPQNAKHTIIEKSPVM